MSPIPDPAVSAAASSLATVIRQIQTSFVRSAEPHRVFDALLPDLLSLCASEYGFIGEVWRDEQRAPFLKIFTMTNIAWDAASRTRVERERVQGIEFRNLKTLFGAALVTEKPVIANDAPRDPRSGGGMPHGHSPLNTFLGVPLHYGGELVGMIGVANRQPGYDEALLAQLDPLFQSMASIIAAVQMERQRRAADAALHDREAQFTKLASKVPGVLMQFHVDAQGHATVPYANAAMQGLFELDPEGPVRHNAGLMIDRVVKGQRGLVWGTLEASGRTLKPWSLEWEVDLPLGGRRWVEGRGTPERLADGSVLWHGYIDDITERRAFQDKLVAAEASTRANQAKTEFLSRMSHELRTPLNAVLGFAQLMASDPRAPLDAAQRTRVAHIERAGQHLLAMIGDVLDLSRIEAGSLPLSLQPVPVSRLIDEALALVEPTAQSAQVVLARSPAAAAGDLHVRADPMRLRQVLVNLLSNAIKYNRAGGQVTVQVHAPDAERPAQVRVAVVDTGVGLSAAQQAHLFEPFNRLGAEHGSIEGTGLGLAITLRLVELMEGAISVHSTQGKGSTFWVDLPLDAAAPPPAVPASSAHTPGHDGVSVGRAPAEADQTVGAVQAVQSVLYAEDNELNIELMRQLLTLRPDCELRVAHTGQEAIAAALASPPDLLLLDMHLGDMDGLQVIAALRDEPALRGVPRIALSADALQQSIAAARAAGFDEYLTKPVDMEELLRCLDRHRAGPMGG